MNCPNCNTWNPEDKDVCWRCQQTMPRPVEKKQKTRAMWGGLPVWLWVALILFFVATSIGQCFIGGNMGAVPVG